MISQQSFDDCMTMLMKHFEKQLEPMVLSIWREELDQHFLDEEFTEAVRQLIIGFEPRYKGHFPTLKQLIEQITGSKQSLALQGWQLVVLAASRGDETHLAYLDARGRVALQGIGGLRAVGMADEWKRTALEKSFVTIYCQCADKDAKSLPPARSKNPAAEEFVPMPEAIKRQMQELKLNRSLV